MDIDSDEVINFLHKNNVDKKVIESFEELVKKVEVERKQDFSTFLMMDP